MTFTLNNDSFICFHKIHLQVRFSFLFKSWESALMFKKSFESSLCIHNTFLHGLTAYFFDPLIFWIIWNVLIIQPFGKVHSGYESFFFLVYFLIMRKIEVIDKSACTNCAVNYLCLFWSWVNFRFVTL